MRKLANAVAVLAKRRVLFWLVSIVIAGLFFGLISFCLLNPVKKLIDRAVIERFHKIYYNRRVYLNTYYLGVVSVQYPADNWVMQEIISEIKPDCIIETGTGFGGTVLFYATILEKVNENGKVITVDINLPDSTATAFKIWKERVEFIKGSSVSPEIIAAIAERAKGRKVLITLDSDHSKEHVLKELKLYAPLVSLGSYLVVQDTHFNGHPIRRSPGGDPWGAVEEFLKTNNNFAIDHSREKHIITQYPSGFLKRIK